ncbi:hypothetical protein VD659_09655 [Herbiconiux sp. 11R-BC]
MPAPLVDDLVAYSYQVTTKHANENAVEYATYANSVAPPRDGRQS